MKWIVLHALWIASVSFTAAEARTLDEIKERGKLTLCAYPTALPFSSEKGNLPGIHVEIASEIAAALGVALKVNWIIPRSRMAASECDIGFDEVEGEEARGYGITASKPYLRTGVALAVRVGVGVKGFSDLTKDMRIGAPLGSSAEAYLRSRGLVPQVFAMAQEMQQALDAGALDVMLVPAQQTAHALHVDPKAVFDLVHAYRDEPAMAWNLVIALRKPDQALANEVNAALASLQGGGRLAEIYGRYGIPYLPPK